MKFGWRMSEAAWPSSLSVWVNSVMRSFSSMKPFLMLWPCLVRLNMKLAAAHGFKKMKDKIATENQSRSQLLIYWMLKYNKQVLKKVQGKAVLNRWRGRVGYHLDNTELSHDHTALFSEDFYLLFFFFTWNSVILSHEKRPKFESGLKNNCMLSKCQRGAVAVCSHPPFTDHLHPLFQPVWAS